MSLFTIGLIGIGIMLVLIFLRMPIGFVFLAIGFGGVWYLRGFNPALQILATSPYATTTSYVWTAIPMFLLMGYFASRTGVIEEAYSGLRSWVGHFRGGLAHSIILGNAAYGAMSGSG